MNLENFTFTIFGTKWSVKFADAIKINDEDTKFHFGLCDSINKVISIATKFPNGKDISKREIKLSLVHEVVHAIMDEGQYCDESFQEAFVEWLAKCILSLCEQKVL